MTFLPLCHKTIKSDTTDLGKYCFRMAMAKLSIGKCWHSPRHLAPPPHVTTIPNSHGHSQLPSTTYNHSTRPPMAVWQCHVTSRNDNPKWRTMPKQQTMPKWRRTPTNEYKWPYDSQHRQQWAEVRQLASPHPVLWHRIQVVLLQLQLKAGCKP